MITIMQIHLNEPPGDILLFLTGMRRVQWDLNSKLVWYSNGPKQFAR